MPAYLIGERAGVNVAVRRCGNIFGRRSAGARVHSMMLAMPGCTPLPSRAGCSAKKLFSSSKFGKEKKEEEKRLEIYNTDMGNTRTIIRVPSSSSSVSATVVGIVGIYATLITQVYFGPLLRLPTICRSSVSSAPLCAPHRGQQYGIPKKEDGREQQCWTGV